MASYASLFTGDEPNRPAPTGESPYRVLLVDDEPNVLRALQRVFRRENYDVLIADNGEKALQLIAATPVQVVISDYQMPGMNGGELLSKIKETSPDTIRIMLTGHADAGAVMSAVKEGAVYKFILKPWNDDDLRVTIGLALEQYDLIHQNRQLQSENARQNKELSSLAQLAVNNRSQLAITLFKQGLLNEKQVQELHKKQQIQKQPMIKLLLEKAWVPESRIRDLLRKELLIEEVSLDEYQVDPAIIELVPRTFCERNLFVPLKLQERRLTLAMADPLDSGLIEDVSFVSGLQIEPVMAEVNAIESKLKEIYQDQEFDFTEMETLVGSIDPYESIEVIIDDDDDSTLDELLCKTEEPPAIRLVNAIIMEAVRLGVSDIHIQPRTKNILVRYRIDGILVDKIQIPHHLHMPLVSRIKVMAELDISERRRPQDGRITVKTPMRIVDLRISTLPTVTGEKVVMRVLDRNASIYSIDELGFSAGHRERILQMITRPQGIILATGPTGSGKTTTLYSLLQHEATPDKNYVTIEDPVEYFLDMAGQVHIREKIGLNFASVLRAILRQDPDVILLGEIRDFETAEVAFNAALTGHLVYSTLHTNSAVATISRLFDLGLKPYVVATGLEGIIAQRLIRRICEHCKQPSTPDHATLKMLGPLFQENPPASFKGQGCNKCYQSGYSGRAAIYEVLAIDDKLRDIIAESNSIGELSQAVRTSDYQTLIDDAWSKVNAGITTLDEVLRVLGAQGNV